MATSSTDRLSQDEPVAVAEAIRVILMAIVATGWVSLSDATINTIITVIGGLASIGLSIWARNRVTPTANLTAATQPNKEN